MKFLLILTSCALIGGCVHQTATPAKPPNMLKLFESDEVTTFFDSRSILLYEGNPKLRQFYTVINYKKPMKITGLQPVYSSRAIEVVNCERMEMTLIDRIYFSAPFTTGTAVFKKSQMVSDMPQWTPVIKQSINGSITGIVCSLNASVIRSTPKEEAPKE